MEKWQWSVRELGSWDQTQLSALAQWKSVWLAETSKEVPGFRMICLYTLLSDGLLVSRWTQKERPEVCVCANKGCSFLLHKRIRPRDLGVRCLYDEWQRKTPEVVFLMKHSSSLWVLLSHWKRAQSQSPVTCSSLLKPHLPKFRNQTADDVTSSAFGGRTRGVNL